MNRELRILCFGDSNTWGYTPGSGRRFPSNIRWSAQLASILKSSNITAKVIEDGVCGRTTCYPTRFRPGRSGLSSIAKSIRKAQPIDIIIISLGINDLKKGFAETAQKTTQGIKKIVEQCRIESANAQILLLSPPPIPKELANGLFSDAAGESNLLAREYSKLAAELKLLHLPIGSIIKASSIDGIHYEANSHQQLGQSVAKMIKPLLERKEVG